MFNLCFALPFVLPWHHQPIASFYNEISAAILFLCGLFFFAVRRVIAPPNLRIGQIALLPLLLIAVITLQVCLGYYAYTANALMLIAYSLLAFFSMVLANNLAAAQGITGSLRYLVGGVIIAGFLNLIAALLQKTLIPDFLQNWVVPALANRSDGAYGNLAQQNHFANLQALSCLCWVYLSQQKRVHTALRLGLLGCFFIGLILSGARSAFVYLVIIICYALTQERVRVSELLGSRGKLWLVFALALLVWFFLSLPGSHWQRYLHLSESLGARGFLWLQTIPIILHYPWLGVGFEGFAYHLIKQMQTSDSPAWWGVDQFPHNLILQLAAQAGMPFVLAMLLALLALLGRLRQQLHRPGRGLVLALLAVMAWHSLIEQPLNYLYFLLPSCFLIGLLDRQFISLSWPTNKSVRYALALFACLGILITQKVRHDYARLEAMLNQPNWLNQQAQQNYRTEIELIREWRSYFSYPGILEAMFPQALVAVDANPEAKLELNYRLLRYAPVAEVVFRHAALYAQLGQPDQAKIWLRTAALAYPYQTQDYLEKWQYLCQQQAAVFCELTQDLKRFQDTHQVPAHVNAGH